MAKRRGITFAFPFCILGGFLSFLQEKSAQKKPLPVNVSRLAAWGARLGLRQSAVALVRLLSVADFNSTIKTKNKQAQQIETKGGAEEFGDPTKLPL